MTKRERIQISMVERWMSVDCSEATPYCSKGDAATEIDAPEPGVQEGQVDGPERTHVCIKGGQHCFL